VPELRRHDPDDCVEITIEANFPADGIWVACEGSPPETVAEYNPIDEPRPLIVLGVQAT